MGATLEGLCEGAGELGHTGNLEDYAYLSEGLLELFQTKFEPPRFLEPKKWPGRRSGRDPTRWVAVVCSWVWVNGIPLWSIWQIQYRHHASRLETCSHGIQRTNLPFIILPIHLKSVSNHPWMFSIHTHGVVFLDIRDLSPGGFSTPKNTHDLTSVMVPPRPNRQCCHKKSQPDQ